MFRAVGRAVTGPALAPSGASGRLAGLVVLVTGAASGLGRATAVQLSAEGAHVALTDRDDAGLADSAELVARQDGTTGPGQTGPSGAATVTVAVPGAARGAS